jgi:DNA-binding transcriptional ArsR family regulator
VQDLKADLIQRIEQTIDVLRKDEERFKTQLAEIEPQLEEARAMLRLIKTGKAEAQMSKRRPMTKREDAVEALKLFTDEFSYKEYAEVLDLNPSAAQRWLSIFEEEGLIFKFRDPEMTTNGRTATIWKVK